MQYWAARAADRCRGCAAPLAAAATASRQKAVSRGESLCFRDAMCTTVHVWLAQVKYRSTLRWRTDAAQRLSLFLERFGEPGSHPGGFFDVAPAVRLAGEVVRNDLFEPAEGPWR